MARPSEPAFAGEEKSCLCLAGKVKNSADPLQACGCAVVTVDRVADFGTCAVGSSRRSRSTYFCFRTNVDPGDGVS